VTVLEVIQRGTEFLARKGVESPRLQVEWLLAQLLQMPRLKLYLNFERALAEAEVEALRAQLKRRAEREPLQHILGSASFCGLEIAVNRNVLIPRPETEQLAERAWEWLKQQPGPQRVLDFGTGSGCLAIALVVNCPTTEVHATDISPAALEVARQNAQRHKVNGRVQFHLGGDLAAAPAGLRFDLLVSNPPYIPSAQIEHLQPEVRDFDPRSALDGGPDGLDFFRLLAHQAPSVLAPMGRMMLEFGDGQQDALRALLEEHGWQEVTIEADYSRRPRFCSARRKK
jgi:release factor glutamine methyltransferase